MQLHSDPRKIAIQADTVSPRRLSLQRRSSCGKWEEKGDAVGRIGPTSSTGRQSVSKSGGDTGIQGTAFPHRPSVPTSEARPARPGLASVSRRNARERAQHPRFIVSLLILQRRLWTPLERRCSARFPSANEDFGVLVRGVLYIISPLIYKGRCRTKKFKGL